MRSSRRSLARAVLLAGLGLVACGGDGPFSASRSDVVVRGTVLGVGSAAAAATSAGGDARGLWTVTVVEDPAITATVSDEGRFTLRGLPAGGFSLTFALDGTVIGTLTFAEVRVNQEIEITVQVSGSTLVLVEQKRNGIGHGDLEIEGLVEAAIAVDPAGDSRFRIAGRMVVARPGQTAIRKGGTARGVEDVRVGTRVHVKGVWLAAAQASQQEVLAHEIKIQAEADVGDQPETRDCMISGGKVGKNIELEGTVQSGSASSFMLKVQGHRARHPVQVDAEGARFECHPSSGPKAPSPQECKASVKAGAKVHVSGTLHSCDAGSATAKASKVKVQK